MTHIKGMPNDVSCFVNLCTQCFLGYKKKWNLQIMNTAGIGWSMEIKSINFFLIENFKVVGAGSRWEKNWMKVNKVVK